MRELKRLRGIITTIGGFPSRVVTLERLRGIITTIGGFPSRVVTLEPNKITTLLKLRYEFEKSKRTK